MTNKNEDSCLTSKIETTVNSSQPRKRKLPEHNQHKRYERKKRKPLRNTITPIDIYLRGHVPIQVYFKRAIQLLETEKKPYVLIHALGKLTSKAVSLASMVKDYGQSQFDVEVTTDTVKVIDELVYKDITIEPELDIRNTSALHIKIKYQETFLSQS